MIEIIGKWISLKLWKKISVILGLFIIPMLLIQIPYWLGKIVVLIPTDFEASDILSYFGSFISALGTVALGAVAIWQNEKFKEQEKINEHFTNIVARKSEQPVFNLELYTVGEEHIYFNFENVGQNPAYKINIFELPHEIKSIYDKQSDQYAEICNTDEQAVLNNKEKMFIDFNIKDYNLKQNLKIKTCFAFKVEYIDSTGISRYAFINYEFDIDTWENIYNDIKYSVEL
jgi:hypothetical protein